MIGRIESLTTAEAAKHRLARMKVIAPNCQLSPVMKKSSAAKNDPAQAKPASRSFLRDVRSATAPSTGRTNAESRVEKVMTYAGSAPGAIDRPSTETRSSTAASSAMAMR